MAHASRYAAKLLSHPTTVGFSAGLMVLTVLMLGPALPAGAGRAQTKLHTAIVRVSPSLAPYNPQLASAGLPIEQVTFAVRPEPPKGNYFNCAVSVNHLGKLVGHSQAAFYGPWDYPPKADLFAAGVRVRKTFKATPGDATVRCQT